MWKTKGAGVRRKCFQELFGHVNFEQLFEAFSRGVKLVE